MYYLIYNPAEKLYRQQQLGSPREVTCATRWFSSISLWDTHEHEYRTSFHSTEEYTAWLHMKKYTILLSSEHPITSTSHPELLL